MSSIIGSLRADLSASIAQFQSDMGKAGDAVEKFARRAKTVSRDLGRVGQEMSLELTAPLVAFAVEAGRAAAKVQDASAQVTAALTSMGNRSGKSLEDLQKQAVALRNTSLFSDADILRNVTASMLAFGNISGKTFDRAQQAAVNLATRMRQGLQPAAELVGKALNDPIRGVVQLTRAGVQFTKAQQDQIKALVRSGQGYQAQEIILRRLEQTFGGAGKAALDASPSGNLLHAWDQLKEDVGAIALEYLPPLIRALTALAQKFEALTPTMQKAVLVTGLIVAAVGPILVFTATVLKAGVTLVEVFGEGGLIAGASEAFGAMAVAIVGVIGGALAPFLVALAAIGAACFVFRSVIAHAVADVVGAFQQGLGKDVPVMLAAFGDVLKQLTTGPLGEFFKVFGYLIAGLVGLVVKSFGPLILGPIDAFVKVLTIAANDIAAALKVVTDALGGDWAKAWKDALKVAADFAQAFAPQLAAIAPQASEAARQVWEGLKVWIGDGVHKLLADTERDFPGLIDALKSAADAAGGWAKSLFDRINAWLGDKLGPLIRWTRDQLTALSAFFGGVQTRADNAALPRDADAKKKAAAAAAAPPFSPPPPPNFNMGTPGPGAHKIEEATKAYQKAIQSLGDQVARGLDEIAQPKAITQADALRRKIDEITDTAAKAGVGIGAFAGQINLLRAQITRLETEGLAKEAKAFGLEVDKDALAVKEFAKGGLAPLDQALASVDDKYESLRLKIQDQIDANASLADHNADAAASMAKLKDQLLGLAAAHMSATDAARAQVAAEERIANLQANSAMLDQKNAINDLQQVHGQAPTPIGADAQNLQQIQRDLAKQQADAATALADLEAKYDAAKQVGDQAAMTRLGQQIANQKQLLDLVDSTTAAQIDAAQKSKSAWSTFADGLASSLSDMIVNWKFDLGSLTNVFKKLLQDLLIDPAIQQLESLLKGGGGPLGFLKGIGGALGSLIGGGGGAAADAASPAIDNIASFFAGGFASGGSLSPGTWGVAGEKGPEPIFAGNAHLSVLPHSVDMRAAQNPPNTQGGRGDIYIDARGAGPREIDDLRAMVHGIQGGFKQNVWAAANEGIARKKITSPSF